MNAYKRVGRSILEVKVPSRDGTWYQRTTGTKDRHTAKRMQQMLHELGPSGRREWELLDAVAARTLSVAALFDAWLRDELGHLRARLEDLDLATKISGWQKQLASHVEPDTAAHYLAHIRSLVPEGEQLLRSRLTQERLTDWLNALECAAATKRKYHASASSFFSYCVQIRALADNPMRRIQAPRAGKPRDRHLDTADAIRLADAQPEPYRTISALLAGTGLEVSVACALRRRDVDVKNREIRARGTKNHNRDRVARVSEWAWPFLARHIVGLLADAPLFPGVDRWFVADAHRDACAALKISDYTARDARHTWAVRMARAGTPPQQIAKQLGHKDATMVLKVYGLYFPSQAEREHWEKIAAAQDRSNAREAGK